MTVSNLKSITLFVADQDAALAFYAHKLGFTVRQDVSNGEHRWLEVVPQNAQTGVLLLRPFPGIQAGTARGIMLAVPDVETAATELREAGVEVSGPTQMPWGLEATFSDPDGNGFVLSAA
ncbi:Glyoxalase-like domain protein [Microbacterium laevaniformans]|uniref:Glyoxalase-like domain protein n=1 Tax=Microbacterium laevaniformans TaxID=36807 RepID=A0A150HIJ6_9MICO|nr:VOC family protein [Microbacterium laevaniformans]KXZ61962.1 Glyoxalase-like domain protein [Microbacterium laevaniformans]